MLKAHSSLLVFLVFVKSDKILIEEAVAGSEEAYSLLTRKYYKRILNFLRKKVYNYALAEDLTQDTFLSAFSNLKHFRHESELYTWLCKIGIRKVYKLRKDVFGEEIESYTDYTPERHLELKEELSQATAFLKKLPKIQQDALLYREFDGMSYKEICSLLSCSKGYAQNLVSNAKKSLRKDLKDD
jgi:RNA polymerase sigma-70 factor (ECF subfamily)